MAEDNIPWENLPIKTGSLDTDELLVTDPATGETCRIAKEKFLLALNTAAAIANNKLKDIEGKIPTAASSTNQLADKSFVNSTVGTNTAIFRGTFNSVAELNAYSGAKTNNDYAFVVETDTAGNTVYKRYKYNGTSWVYEYSLNNSSFTAAQWASVNSGATADNIAKIADIDGKVPVTRKVNNHALTGDINITKSDVGLGNCNNTSDANKPISTATQTALDGKQATLVSGTNIKTINGVSILGSGNLPVAAADQVQADWNVTDETSKAFIKNKPDIITVSSSTPTSAAGSWKLWVVTA